MDEKLNIKKRLIELCIAGQLKVAENCKSAMVEAQQAANEYGAPKDRYDSFRSQLIRRHAMYASQYQKALQEITTLEWIKLEKCIDIIGFGAVVITDSQRLFVSISAGKIELEGEVYFAISTGVPFFQAMKDLKKGDNFQFNNKSHKILDVF